MYQYFQKITKIPASFSDEIRSVYKCFDERLVGLCSTYTSSASDAYPFSRHSQLPLLSSTAFESFFGSSELLYSSLQAPAPIGLFHASFSCRWRSVAGCILWAQVSQLTELRLEYLSWSWRSCVLVIWALLESQRQCIHLVLAHLLNYKHSTLELFSSPFLEF